MNQNYFSATVKFLISLIIILNSSCQQSNEPKYQVQDVIMPLAIGNVWIGRVQVIDSNNNVISTYYDTLRIVDDTTVNNYILYYEENNFSYYRNSEWGLFVDGYLNEPGEQNFLKYPGINGQQWIEDTMRVRNKLTFELDTLTYGLKIFSIDTTIKVPHGTYSCYYYKPVVQKLDGTLSNIPAPLIGWYWYSPGYGPIKFIYYDLSDTTGTIKEVWELIYRELY